jgi:hypothetical protein
MWVTSCQNFETEKHMKTNALLICSFFAVASLRGEQADQQQQAPNKPARVQQAQGQGQAQVAPKVHQQNPAFYRRSTAPGSTWQPHGNSQTPVRNQNQAYTRGQVQHFNLSNTANPRISSARFNASGHIVGSERWQGHNYAAFRSYHPEWHDRNWWRSHHTRIVLIGGGYYFWDGGWWYPAWGYDNAYSNVQTALQQEGYYEGEVDGFLGPLTRAALADYQRDHGLYTTAAIDEPTLASLGMG